MAEQTNDLAAMASPSTPWPRRVGRLLLLAALLGLAVELAFRLFMAIQLGPRAILYGTPMFRQEISVAKRKDAEWQGGRTPGISANVRPGYSKYFPNETKIDQNDKGERLTYQVNRHGFRGPDFEIAKAPGVVRVLTLGGSSTFGLGSSDSETYPSQLQARLNQRCSLGKSYEVINLGIPHLTSPMIRALFMAEGVPLAPDVVTFYEGYNDTATNPGALTTEGLRDASRTNELIAAAYRRLVPIYRSVRDWSMTLLLLDNMVQTSQRSTPEQVSAYRSTRRAEEFLANLRGIRDAAEKNGAKFIAVSQQSKSYAVPRESIHGVSFAEEKRRVEAKLAAQGSLTLQELYFLAHSDMMDALKQWARADNVAFVDGIQSLDENREELYTWVHLTPRANVILADAITDEILRQTCK